MKISICGSMGFTENMLEAQKLLKAKGHEVFVSGFAQHYVGKSEKEKENLTLYHKNERDAMREFCKKIKNSDAILVLNYDRKGIKNYIGGNTLIEIGYAYILGKKIFLLNTVQDIEYYKDEIVATKPIILNGDINAVN